MNRRLLMLLISNAVFMFGTNMLVPVYSLFIADIGGGPELAGLLFGLQFAANGLMGLIVIRIKDRKDLDEQLYKLQLLVRGLALFAVGISPHIWTFVFAQIVIGLAEGFGSPAFNAIVSEHLDKGGHIREWGAWELIRNPTLAVSSVLSGIIVVVGGFNVLFYIMSALAILSWLLYNQMQASYRKTA